jgi:hypothetical protein
MFQMDQLLRGLKERARPVNETLFWMNLLLHGLKERARHGRKILVFRVLHGMKRRACPANKALLQMVQLFRWPIERARPANNAVVLRVVKYMCIRGQAFQRLFSVAICFWLFRYLDEILGPPIRTCLLVATLTCFYFLP